MLDQPPTDAETASRFAHELADLRILYDNSVVARDFVSKELEQRDKEIASLKRIISTIHAVTDDDQVRLLCEDVITGEIPK